MNDAKTEIVFFGEEITLMKVTNQKTAQGSSPSEDVFCTLETNDG
jgi:hypothetical protein